MKNEVDECTLSMVSGTDHPDKVLHITVCEHFSPHEEAFVSSTVPQWQQVAGILTMPHGFATKRIP
jgi:hypothetical protein